MNVEGSLPLYEDTIDMLGDVVRALGGPKKVGPMLRGNSLPTEQASQWVRDCLNRERREKFDPEQVLQLLRSASAVGFHAGKHWLDSELGYEQGKPLSPKDEAAAIQQKINTSLAELRHLVARMERLGQSPLSVVSSKPA
jgi:uncharacterized protein YidB (DUF937 family)